ncbi:MAG: hypothetical protein ACREUS_01700 [Burkholderiales bacterium]
MTAFTLNGKPVTSKSEASTPLLWVIRDELNKLTGKRLYHMRFTPARVQQVLKT